MTTTSTTSGRHPGATRSRLNDRHVADYRREGFTILNEPILAPAKFEALKAHFDQKLAQWPADQRPEGMDVPHFTDPALFEWIFDDAILDLVEPLIGPDIALFSTHFICKPKGDGRRVPWHEDSAYWKTALEPMEVVTVWLAIDPSTKANGCMRVIPRTHEGTAQAGFSDYDDVDPNQNVFPTEITPKQRNDALAVDIELQANEASLHDAKLMHGSEANTSDLRRCGYTMRFMPSSVKLSEKNQAYHQLYLARGKNLSGQTCYGDPTQAYDALRETRLQRGKAGH
ncbi:MAG: phytanoyl-CoA dioxygenase family protein [Opitutales bacterium]